MRLLLLLIILTITLVSGNSNFVDNRSGQIVIQPTEVKSSQLFLKGSVFDKTSISNIKDVQVSNLITHVMGLLPLNEQDNDRSGYPSVSVFNKPKLNLFFSVDSIADSDLVNSKVLNSENIIAIEKTFDGQDPLAELTTIVTGVSPSEHGISSSTWINPTTGFKVHSYGKQTQSSAANIAYLANTSFNGKSLIISASADRKSAQATGIHSGISSLYADADIYTYSLLPSGNVAPVHGSKSAAPLNMANKEVETILYTKEFQQFVLPTGWKASLNNGIFTIVTDKNTVHKIDFDSYESAAILSELATLFNIVKTIKTNDHFKQLAKDSVPDFISFDFSSIADIRSNYGSHSVAFKVALAMVEQAIQSTYTQLSGVYGDRIACEIITLAPKTTFSQNQIDAINEAVGEESVHDIKETLPHIFVLPSSASEVDTICNNIKNALSSETTLTTDCHKHSFIPVSYIVEAPAPPTGGSSSATISNGQQTANTNKIAAFQIFLFFSIVLALFIIAGILFIMQISEDSKKDTLLYRSSERQY